MGAKPGMMYLHPSFCAQLRSRPISVPGTTLGLKAMLATAGSSCARCRAYMRRSSLEAQYLASPRSTILSTCSCERTGSASTSGSCHVARPIPIRQKASGSCTSLDVMTMRPPDRSSPFRRSTIRKCARKLTAKASSNPSADDRTPVTVWMPAFSASASIGRGPSKRTTSPHARSTAPRLARSALTMASRSEAPVKDTSASACGDGRASKMTDQFARSLSSLRKTRRPMPLVPPVITRHLSPGPDRLPPEIGLIASPSVMFEAPRGASLDHPHQGTLRCEHADLAVVSWPQLQSGGLAGGEECIELGSRRQTRAGTQPRAFERGHGGGHTGAVGSRSPLGNHQREGAMKGITGPRRVRHADAERGHMTAALALAPEIALAPERHARMLGAQRQHMAEPLGIGIAGRELAQGRRAKDGMIGELENAADRFAGAEIGIEDGRHFLLTCPAEYCPQAFEPAYVAQHRVRFLDALQRQPARARRHAGVALADDQPLS